jgi:hypothetical protein
LAHRGMVLAGFRDHSCAKGETQSIPSMPMNIPSTHPPIWATRR